MKSVNVADLKDNLSSYLREVLRGEEILIRNRRKPIARIVPISSQDLQEEEQQLVSEGRMRMPELEMAQAFWNAFWKERGPELSLKKAAQAITEDRREE
jgi:prevent-host-death family protein